MNPPKVTCKICSSPSDAFATAKVLRRHIVTYFTCPICDFIQSEEPFWLPEAYASAINRTDIGYASRNLEIARYAFSLVRGLFDPRKRFIDYGAGYGLFVRLMRDKGLDWYWDDKHCQNLFAQGFEAQSSHGFELVSCFEVMEHTVNPLEDIGRMLAYAPTIFFSTASFRRRVSNLRSGGITDWTTGSTFHFSRRSRSPLSPKNSAFRFGQISTTFIF